MPGGLSQKGCGGYKGGHSQARRERGRREGRDSTGRCVECDKEKREGIAALAINALYSPVRVMSAAKCV